MLPVECHQGFSKFELGDLVFDTRWPIFELGLEIMETTFLTYFQDIWVENVTSRVLTRFFHILAVWPSFWPQITNIRTWPRNHGNNHSQDIWAENVTSRVLTRIFHIQAVWPSFWPLITHIKTWAKNHRNNLPEKFSGYLGWKCYL
jgi:hypothetical protein